MLPPNELPASVPDTIGRRVQLDSDANPRFGLADDSPAAESGPLALTQRDVRELQLAGGAIRTGIIILLQQAGLNSADLKQVLLAGGFGSFIRRKNAQRIGLMPGDIDHEKIHYVGNTSLGGAKWALLSTSDRKRAEQLARQARHVELSTDVNFQAEFIEAMIFPSA